MWHFNFNLKVELKVGILRRSSAFILGFFLNLILYPKEIISDENWRKSYNIGGIVTQLSITGWESWTRKFWEANYKFGSRKIWKSLFWMKEILFWENNDFVQSLMKVLSGSRNSNLQLISQNFASLACPTCDT
jgi:hypothetical protein